MRIYIQVCDTVISFCSVLAFDPNLLMITGCYTEVTVSTTIMRYRSISVLYYYRTYSFGWRGSWR